MGYAVLFHLFVGARPSAGAVDFGVLLGPARPQERLSRRRLALAQALDGDPVTSTAFAMAAHGPEDSSGP